jgi:molybdenum-dependent DNA-binding transcriptional regulator ModE
MRGLRLTVRVDLEPTGAVGPGKIRLLEAIDRTAICCDHRN